MTLVTRLQIASRYIVINIDGRYGDNATALAINQLGCGGDLSPGFDLVIN